MFKLRVKLSKENDKLERSIILRKKQIFKLSVKLSNYIEFMENNDKAFGNEIIEIRRELVKCETYASLKNVYNLHVTLGKFNEDKENLH